MKKIGVFVLLLFIGFNFCTKNPADESNTSTGNRAPDIVSITVYPEALNIFGAEHVGSTLITVIVTDYDDTSITYTFSAALGKLSNQNGKEIMYTPPPEPGDYFIKCSVSDGKETDFDSVSVSVTQYTSKIAFCRCMGSNMGYEIFEIYVMDSDGSNQISLTNNNGYNVHPSWSPDGSKIAFASNKDKNVGSPPDIYVMNADGSNQIRLTNNSLIEKNPSWSPDGTKIAFEREYNIYVMNADGFNQIRLTYNEGYYPSWSPDGYKIAFSIGGIYVMNADGSNITKLTDYWDDDPSWSPDGSKIAFLSSRGNGWDSPYEIFVMNADGSNQKTLINYGEEELWGIFGSPSWSPDGSMIVFSISYISSGIYIVNADGSNIVRLTDKKDRSPSWSPFIK